MLNLIARLIGLLLAVFGAALLAYLARVFYTPTARWLDVLVAIGMPAMLLLTLLGVASLGGGLALAARRGEDPQPPVDRRYAHVRASRAHGKRSENKG